MKKVSALLVFLGILTVSAVGQSKDAEIKRIRELYTQSKAEITKIEGDSEAAFASRFAVNELVVNKLGKSWAAVGNYKVIYRFYYEAIGEQPYPEHLVFVSRETQSSARKYYEEFLFDADGSVAFVFWKHAGSGDSDASSESRFYFKSDELILANGKSKNVGEESPSAKTALSTAKTIQKMFKLSL